MSKMVIQQMFSATTTFEEGEGECCLLSMMKILGSGSAQCPAVQLQLPTAVNIQYSPPSCNHPVLSNTSIDGGYEGQMLGAMHMIVS